MSRFLVVYESYCAHFVRAFYQVQQEPGSEQIHQMRLSIKKLKAIWSFMEVMSQGQWNKREHWAYIQPLFKQAGALRECQINLQLANRQENTAFDAYVQYMAKKESQAFDRLKKKIRNFDIAGLSQLNNSIPSSIFSLPKATLLQITFDYLDGLRKQIKKLSKQLPNAQKMHKIRIQLKALFSIISLLQKLNNQRVLRKTKKGVKALNQKIGEWHDQVEWKHSIKGFMKKTKRKTTRRDLKRFMRRIHKKEIASQKHLKKMIKTEFLDNLQPALKSFYST